MPILPIRRYPDPILRKRSIEIHRINRKVELLIDDMIETMSHSPNTIGLAAPQVGHGMRLIAVDVTPKEKQHGLIVLINPILSRGFGSKIVREGCLSLPDYTGNVKRYEWVIVHGIDRTGRPVEIESYGIEAVCLQHEIDHVDGMMFLDRVESLKTDVFRRKRYGQSRHEKLT